MVEGLGELLRDAGSATNNCSCSFCSFHKDAHAQYAALPEQTRRDIHTPAYPPETPARLASAMMCPKPALRPGSGFSGRTHYPVHDLNCIKQCLEEPERKFLRAKAALKPGAFAQRCNCCQPVEREAPCDAHSCCACAGKFVLKPPAHCTFITQGTVTYKHMVKVPRRGGAAGAQRDEVAETTVPRSEFMRIFPSQFSMWLLHMHIADWQDAIAEELMNTPHEGHAVIGQDFGMNYTCQAGHELKGGFFEREQVSLHTILVYSEWPPDWDELSYPDLMQRAKQMMQTIVYFSDDKHHDATYVKHNHRHLYRYLAAQRKQLGLKPLSVATILSDGGPGHYKQARNFYNMTEMVADAAPFADGTLPCPDSPNVQAARLPFHLCYEFLAPDHGKGQWDGITSAKKNKLMSAEKSDLYGRLSNSRAIVNFLEKYGRKKNAGHEKAPYPVRAASHFSAEFSKHVHTDADELEMERAGLGEADTVAGTRSHFSYIFDRPGELRMRWLGCPCVRCKAQQYDDCVHADMVGVYKHRRVTVNDRRGVREREIWRRLEAQRLHDELEVGDVVAVYAEDDRRKYWLARVVRANLRVTEEEGERVCPHTDWKFRGPVGNGSGSDGNSKGEAYLEVEYLRCPSEAPTDDRNFVTEVNSAASERQPFLISPSLLRQRVCGKEEWEGWRAVAVDSSSDDDEAPLHAASWRTMWRLPQDKHEHIIRRIDNEFRDGLYSLDPNVREGEVHREVQRCAGAEQT